jgi:acetyl-CoA carboxylase carboxyl transferase subunit alpha
MATVAHLDFEKSIAEVEQQIDRLQGLARERGLDVSAELLSLERKLQSLKRDVFRNLSPIERVQVARHPRRPYTLDYLELIFTDFIELHGDRMYRDDASIVGGWARFEGETVMVIGHQKGRDMKENLLRNFGMPHPEGYRKALRLMKMAEKFGRPVVCLIDTPGAYPGLGAEERGRRRRSRGTFARWRRCVPSLPP